MAINVFDQEAVILKSGGVVDFDGYKINLYEYGLWG